MKHSMRPAVGFTVATWLLLASEGALAQCCGDCNGDGQVTIDEILKTVNRGLTGCIDDGICSTSDGQRLPSTGQTMCWDINGAVIACSGTGQDGAIQAGGALAYVDNGDGTITDLNTQLMWEKKVAMNSQRDEGNLHDADNCYPWGGWCKTGLGVCATDADCGANGPCQVADCQGAWPNGLTIFQWIAQLNAAAFAGYSDWRVPNIRELQSIIDYQNEKPAVASAFNGANCGETCTDLGSAACSCTCSISCLYPLGDYWSSTAAVGAPYVAWGVDFAFARTNDFYKESGLYVRAVRGGL